MKQRLPSDAVCFGADFLTRVGALQARMRSDSRRMEGAGRLSIGGAGSEFVGFRPYRPGEDLRLFDWNLYSRMRLPFVRVTRREANQSWALLLDSSASMGIGTPGKLQAAAEAAAALAALALGDGSKVTLIRSSDLRALTLSKEHDIQRCMDFLVSTRAVGANGLASLLAQPARFRAAGSLFLLGDLLDLEPRDALSLVGRGRQMHILQWLAAEELTPPEVGNVVWLDPETDQSRAVALTRDACARYDSRLQASLYHWKESCLKHRAKHALWSSSAAFEDVLRGVLGA